MKLEQGRGFSRVFNSTAKVAAKLHKQTVILPFLCYKRVESWVSSVSECWVEVPSDPPGRRTQPWRTPGRPSWEDRTRTIGNKRPLLAASLCTLWWRVPACPRAPRGPAGALRRRRHRLQTSRPWGAADAGSVGGWARGPWWPRCADSRAGTAGGRRSPPLSPRACGLRKSGSGPLGERWWTCPGTGRGFSPAGPLDLRCPLRSTDCRLYRRCACRLGTPTAGPLWWPGKPSARCSRGRTWRWLLSTEIKWERVSNRSQYSNMYHLSSKATSSAFKVQFINVSWELNPFAQ